MPRSFGNRCGMCVHPYLPASSRWILLGCKATQVNLGNRVRWELVDVLVRVVSHIVRAHDDIADVAQQFASSSPDDLRKEFGLVDCRWAKSDVARRILNQVRTA